MNRIKMKVRYDLFFPQQHMEALVAMGEANLHTPADHFERGYRSSASYAASGYEQGRNKDVRRLYSRKQP